MLVRCGMEDDVGAVLKERGRQGAVAIIVAQAKVAMNVKRHCSLIQVMYSAGQRYMGRYRSLSIYSLASDAAYNR
jgi:hypothetical protein